MAYRPPAVIPTPWLMPQRLADAIATPTGTTPVNLTFKPDGGPILGPPQVASFASLVELRVAIASSGLIPPGTVVLYDLEAWEFTPAAEQAAPFEAMRAFIAAAAAAGLVSAVAPGGKRKLTASRLHPDIFVAQLQAHTDPKDYVAELAALAENMDPGEALIAELSTNRVETAGDLYRIWNAAREIVGDDGFALWCGDPLTTDQAAMADAFLSRMAANSGSPAR